MPLTTCRFNTGLDSDWAPTPSLIVDYNKPLSVVYQNLAIYFINRDRNLGILRIRDSEKCSTQSDMHGYAELDLRTWTPNWSDLARYGGTPTEEFLSCGVRPYEPYVDTCIPLGRWCGSRAERAFQVLEQVQNTINVDVLRLEGVILGEIEAQTPGNEYWTHRDPPQPTRKSPSGIHDPTTEVSAPQMENTVYETRGAFHGTTATAVTAPSKFWIRRGGALGDLVVILDSVDSPFVLRRLNEMEYTFVGVAQYVEWPSDLGALHRALSEGSIGTKRIFTIR